MGGVGVLIAAALIVIILTDAFEVMILPRRVRHGYRLARQYYRWAWILWRFVAANLPQGRWRQGFLSVFGPLSLFVLIAIWATGLITGFALLHWSLHTATSGADGSFTTYLYLSGTTFFTLGYGDLVPTGSFGRFLSVVEAGLGFGFLALVISYLPVLHQAFARREITISLLDARAGSPPTAAEVFRRLGEARGAVQSEPIFVEWERWAAELLESHLSFPVLSYYRSQHDNQSWLAALTLILDTSALCITGLHGSQSYQARLTFAMARHAAVDLGLVFKTRPQPPQPDRLADADFEKLRETARPAGLAMLDSPDAAKALAELRGLYEPFLNSLAGHFQFALPPFDPAAPTVDNWQTSPWTPRSPGLTGLQGAGADDEHRD
jgi:Ion channel